MADMFRKLNAKIASDKIKKTNVSLSERSLVIESIIFKNNIKRLNEGISLTKRNKEGLLEFHSRDYINK